MFIYVTVSILVVTVLLWIFLSCRWSNNIWEPKSTRTSVTSCSWKCRSIYKSRIWPLEGALWSEGCGSKVQRSSGRYQPWWCRVGQWLLTRYWIGYNSISWKWTKHYYSSPWIFNLSNSGFRTRNCYKVLQSSGKLFQIVLALLTWLTVSLTRICVCLVIAFSYLTFLCRIIYHMKGVTWVFRTLISWKKIFRLVLILRDFVQKIFKIFIR